MVWATIFSVAGLVVGLAGLALFLFARERRVLSWTEKPSLAIARPASEPIAGLEVSFRGKGIDRATIHSLRLQNSGKAITEYHQREPLTIFLSDVAPPSERVLDGWVQAQSEGFAPPKLEATSDGTLAVHPCVWNRGDWAEIRVLSTADAGRDLDIKGPIIDGELKRVVPSERRAAWAQLSLGLIVLMASVVGMWGHLVLPISQEQALTLVFVPIVLFLAGLAVLAIVLDSNPIRILRGKRPRPPAKRPPRAGV